MSQILDGFKRYPATAVVARTLDSAGAGSVWPAVIVIGLGGEGALLALKDSGRVQHVPAVFTRPVANTIGAGDALFSSFLHGYLQTADPLASLRNAVVFASYKIGAVGAADGFLTAVELEKLARQLNDKQAEQPDAHRRM